MKFFKDYFETAGLQKQRPLKSVVKSCSVFNLLIWGHNGNGFGTNFNQLTVLLMF